MKLSERFDSLGQKTQRIIEALAETKKQLSQTCSLENIQMTTTLAHLLSRLDV
jgi:hypothetical protein